MFQTKAIDFNRDKNFWITLVIALVCLILSASFPVQNQFQIISRSIFFLVIIPVLYIKLILKEDLRDWGWNLQNKKTGIIWSLSAIGLGAVIFYLLYRFTGFLENYKLSPAIKNNFGFFLFYELVVFNIFLFAQEFFFKGFLLFALKKYAYWGIFIQSGIYFILLAVSKNFSYQSAPLIFFSLLGGLVAYKSKSVVYSYLSVFLFSLIFDAVVIYLSK